MTARLLDVDPREYHAMPQFSASLAKVVISRSPRHAREQLGKKHTKEMDRGDIVGNLLLGRGKAIDVHSFNDWRTDKAKAAKKAAYAAGKAPVLERELEEYSIIAENIRVALADRGIVLDGHSEQAIEWEEPSLHGPVLCRGMFDHVWFSRGLIMDLKVTEDARQSSAERTAENFGYGIQEAAYRRALTAYRPEWLGRERFIFVLAEPDPPREVMIVETDGVFRELGMQRWRRAVEMWGKCLAEQHWPGYEYTHLSAPLWALRNEGFNAND